MARAINEGMEQLNYGLQDIASVISEINATFHWSVGHLIAGMAIADSLALI